MSADAEQRLAQIVHSFEGNVCIDAQHYQRSKGLPIVDRLHAFDRDVSWYQMHSEDMTQRAKHGIYEVQRMISATQPPAGAKTP